MSIDIESCARKTLKILTPPSVLNASSKISHVEVAQQSQKLEKSLDALTAGNKNIVKTVKTAKKADVFPIPSFLEECLKKKKEDSFIKLTTGRNPNPKSARESAEVFMKNGYGAILETK